MPGWDVRIRPGKDEEKKKQKTDDPTLVIVIIIGVLLFLLLGGFGGLQGPRFSGGGQGCVQRGGDGCVHGPPPDRRYDPRGSGHERTYRGRDEGDDRRRP